MNRKRDEQDIEMLRMYQKTADKAAIAAALGLTERQVSHRIARIRTADIAHDPEAITYWRPAWEK